MAKFLYFKPSSNVTIGTELEFQIVNPKSFALISRAKELVRNIKNSPYQTNIKPEITQSMIEINSSIHSSPDTLFTELLALRDFLLQQAEELQIAFCGGGTHPFQRWAMQKIFPTDRYRHLSQKFRYLSKRSTVFGQHIHIGCESSDDALYLTHALIRYAPHFIALSASSPYYQGVDTGYASSRVTVFNSFPLSGAMPYLTTWEAFSDYYYMMRQYGIIRSMKDFYWDIRPKPEFGTVEIRVCDTPLTIKRAAILVAYIQALSQYLLQERPVVVSPELYYLYPVNRFQAARYGFGGQLLDASLNEPCTIGEDIIHTIKKIEYTANQLNTMSYLVQIKENVINQRNDTLLLKQIFKQVNSLPQVVAAQCDLWKSG